MNLLDKKLIFPTRAMDRSLEEQRLPRSLIKPEENILLNLDSVHRKGVHKNRTQLVITVFSSFFQLLIVLIFISKVIF